MLLIECGLSVVQTDEKTVIEVHLPDDEETPYLHHECSPANAALVGSLQTQVDYLKEEVALLRAQLVDAIEKI